MGVERLANSDEPAAIVVLSGIVDKVPDSGLIVEKHSIGEQQRVCVREGERVLLGQAAGIGMYGTWMLPPAPAVGRAEHEAVIARWRESDRHVGPYPNFLTRLSAEP